MEPVGSKGGQNMRVGNNMTMFTHYTEKKNVSSKDEFKNTLNNTMPDDTVESSSNIQESFGNKTADYDSIKTVETDQYIISGKEGGYLRIENKTNGEGFNWKLKENCIQVDEKSGKKFLINDFGAGFFNMVEVDEELEESIKEALGASDLEEKQLKNFTVNQDSKTGIYYITSNGYESQGGQIIMDNNARDKLNSLADVYMKQYSSILKTKEEAWFYASFEVRGMTKRTNDGFMMIGPNNISYKNTLHEKNWTATFMPSDWKKAKKMFDEIALTDKSFGDWNEWDKKLKNNNVKANIVEQD